MSTPGTIGWIDLTVADATGLKDFYAAVTGWVPEPVPVADYQDFSMCPPAADGSAGDAVAGICHARGGNADMPAQWLLYIVVADLDAAMAACTAGGGAVIAGPKSMGDARYCVIRDPAGAVTALYQD